MLRPRVSALGGVWFAACIEPSTLGRDPAVHIQDAATDLQHDAQVAHDASRADACGDACALPAADDPPDGAPCLMNLSFEGTPQISAVPTLQNLLGYSFTAQAWNSCSNATTATLPSIVDQSVSDPLTGARFPPAHDGETYAALREGEGASQGVCTLPLTQAVEFALRFSAYLWQASVGAEPTALSLEAWSSPGFVNSSCAGSEVTSVVPITGSGWNDYCTTISWGSSYSFGLTVAGPGENSPTLYVLVDDLRLTASCP